MKPYLALALFFAAQSLHADWVIVQKTNTAGAETPVTIKIKDNKIRNDMGDKMTVLLDADAGGAQMFMHDQKKLIRMDAAAMKGMTAMAGKFLGDAAPEKPKATGEKVKVGEWDTEVYTWESKIGTAKFYVAKDFPKYAELNKVMDKIAKSMGNPMAAMFPSAADFPGMSVKSEMTMMGKVTTSELVSAKEEAVSADEFKAPEGYTEMKIPGFPGGGAPK
ncbi:MAG: hypothetical protein JWO89_3015 [Verrucomicrobiaceae bacterium]|nr:hypothetical protein [Verrucomicrobiaceae bacterium]